MADASHHRMATSGFMVIHYYITNHQAELKHKNKNIKDLHVKTVRDTPGKPQGTGPIRGEKPGSRMEGLRVQNGKGGKKASIHERIGKPKIWGTEKTGE